MYKETLQKLQVSLKNNTNINADKKKEMLSLIDNLEIEIKEVSKDNRDKASSIAKYTDISTHEATKSNIDIKLLEHSIDGLKSTIEDIEVSYPKLTEIVNSIAILLSNMGI